jgi:phenylalanyl-tRNA synthetase beta chain
VGELHPEVLEGTWGGFELDLERLFAEVRDPVVYEDVITYPAVRQDLAFVVTEALPAAELVEAVRRVDPDVRLARVIDVYRGPQVGEGKKSIALSVEFQSPERTLSGEEATALRDRIVAEAQKRFGAVLRA